MRSLFKLFKRSPGIQYRESDYDGLVGDLVGRVDALELRLGNCEKKAEATRRKVYRDKDKENGSDDPEMVDTADDRFPSPYL